MSHKIAVITTDHIRPHIEAALLKLQLDCQFQIYCYRPVEDIAKLYASIPENVEGILTSGNLFAEAIRQGFPGDMRVVLPFGIDDAALHRLFWRLRDEGRFNDFSRIYSDFLENLHIDIHEFLTVDHETPLAVTMNLGKGNETMENLRRTEELQYQKLLGIWETGEFDLIVTRFSGLIPMLREKGVPVYYPYPSIDNIKSSCIQLLHEIELRRLQDNQTAAIHINLWPSNPSYSTEALFERQCITLQDALMDFLGSSTLDHILRRNHFGFEILTSRKIVAEYTGNYSVCRISDFLKSRLDFRFYVGYGIGQGIYQARLNAINAVRESEVSEGSFLINEKEELIGPLGHGTVLTVPTSPEGFSQVVGKTGLSSLTVSKVLTVLQGMPNRRITSQELSLKLSITRRSSSHFLSAMAEAGILQVVSDRRTTTRGRPEHVYGQASKNS